MNKEMNIIKTIINYKDNLEKALTKTTHELIEHHNPASNLRYYSACNLVSRVILQQLNLEKNKIKGDFTESYLEIINKIIGELLELFEELTKDSLNLNRVLEELGDVGAYLVGLFLLVLKEKK